MTATLTARPGLDLTVHDEFCGAGGSSDGVKQAGAIVTLAVNHNPLAIASHQANFPDTTHDCRDVRKIDPGFYPRADVLIASPECKSHTYAGGRKNLDQEPLFESAAEKKRRLTAIRSRATMDQVLRWIRQHRYQACIIENVGEVVDWSGFQAWRREVDKLGYDITFCWFNSMFFGGGDLGLVHPPQSRDRLYMVLSRKGNPKPDLDHRPWSRCFHCNTDVDAVQSFTPGRLRPMRYRRNYLYACPQCGREAFPYVAPAAAAIDWTLPTPLIGDRKKPLKPATMARIAAGLERYGWYDAMTVPVDRTSDNGHPVVKVPRPTDQPLRAQTARRDLALVVTNRTNGQTRDPDQPLTAMTTGSNHLLVTDRRHGTARAVDDLPSTTFTAGGTHHMLVDPPAYVVSNHNPGWTRDAHTDPIGAHTSFDHHALLMPTNGNLRRGRNPDLEPLPTQTSDKEHGLVVPYDGVARLPSWPLPAQTSVQGDGLVVPAGGGWADQPTPIDGLLVQVGGNTYERPGSACRSRPVSWPMRAQTSTRSEGLVTIPGSFLKPYRQPTPWAKLAGDGVPFPDGMQTLIDACGWRMLTWWEIRNGMAFRPNYVLMGDSRDKIAQLGQAVTPPVMSWLFDRVAASLSPRSSR